MGPWDRSELDLNLMRMDSNLDPDAKVVDSDPTRTHRV